jgi:DNA-binding response OmpR family regulator
VVIKDSQTTVQLEIGKKILVVDDESDVCFVLETVLDENGFVVDSYQDPLLALKRFTARLYDLVILDIRMPELNGFELYREIRRLDKKVKICFLTAGEMYYGAYSDIFSSLPANCFIRKPIENQELMNRINEIIAQDISHIIALNDLSSTNTVW